MKNELISMVDFVLAEKIKRSDKNVYKHATRFLFCEDYATFLNTPLNISMFVPAIKVGDKWEVIYEPTKNYWDIDLFVIKSAKKIYDKKLKQYQTAKDKVIFEGWTLANETQSVWSVYDSDNRLVFMKEDGECLDGKTIQDLIKYKPTLTKKGLEVSGLNR